MNNSNLVVKRDVLKFKSNYLKNVKIKTHLPNKNSTVTTRCMGDVEMEIEPISDPNLPGTRRDEQLILRKPRPEVFFELKHEKANESSSRDYLCVGVV